MKHRTLAVALTSLLMTACGPGGQAPPASQYETAQAEHRSLALTVEASGVIEPVRTVEIKSKASGEILELGAGTGDTVRRGALLVRIDPRTPRNRFDQSVAQSKAAQAKLVNARGQLERGEKLLTNAWINQADYDQLVLNVATAESEVVTAKVTVENARIALDDTEVRAPSDGTILSKRVERGQVISSPTMDVGGGTLLMTMAELDQVQVRARVDETDIGKLVPGMEAGISVASYPGKRFAGTIEKIEPQAIVEQNVTLFPVLISLPNEERLLRPGMNVEASFDVARRENVLTIPVTALRTERDIDTTAAIIGVDAATIRSRVAQPGAVAGTGGGRTASENAASLSGVFWVVVDRNGVFAPASIVTGMTDLDRVEVTQGLAAGDVVLVLPSASLIETQERLQNFMSGRGGIPGITQRAQEQQSAPQPARTQPGR
jgi:HlyD family secretion protein